MLDSPDVRRWLGGVEPAWTLLDGDSFNALRRASPSPEGPIRLVADLTPDDAACSAVARNARLLLEASADGPGLKLTATGNLARSVVAEMMTSFTWPGFNPTHEFRLHKVVNESDYLPLFFIRHIVESTKCLRKHKGHLRLTQAGRRVLDPAKAGALQAALFHTTFWQLNLEYLARGTHGAWPQHDIGLVLWCLSVAGDEWHTQTRLCRLCTVPIIGVLEAAWDTGSLAMEARILRPLVWFGLMETRPADPDGPPWQASHLYRKTTLFDQFLSFVVAVEGAELARH